MEDILINTKQNFKFYQKKSFIGALNNEKFGGMIVGYQRIFFVEKEFLVFIFYFGKYTCNYRTSNGK